LSCKIDFLSFVTEILAVYNYRGFNSKGLTHSTAHNCISQIKLDAHEKTFLGGQIIFMNEAKDFLVCKIDFELVKKLNLGFLDQARQVLPIGSDGHEN
jgi:hypothetical protein